MTPALHVAVPAMVDDPRRPSGGNVYDRELVHALRSRGAVVHEHVVGARLDDALRAVPDGATVVVDGLLGLAQPEALDPRLAVVLLVHLPLSLASPGDAAVADRERQALRAATHVVATSDWTRAWLVARRGLSPGTVSVARPGVHPAPLATSRPSGDRILAVGAVVPAKGQDLLVAALSGLRDRAWTCRVVGSLERAPDFVARLQRTIAEAGLSERVHLDGAVPRTEVAAAYADTDLLVVPTRLESYGMVVSEALACGVPVLATDTGGVGEALGTGPRGRPGVLVPGDHARALRDALDRWLTDPDHRSRLRAAARARRETLTSWADTAAAVQAAVTQARLNHAAAGAVVRA